MVNKGYYFFFCKCGKWVLKRKKKRIWFVFLEEED